MVRDFDRKLRLTAAALGAATCKDLVQAFRRSNAATGVDVERAYKWLQGRSQPRDSGVYREWAELTGLDKPEVWLADSHVGEFAEALAERHGLTPIALNERASTFGGSTAPGSTGSGAAYLAGTYVAYSLAWSPYYAGRLIRGTLVLAERGRDRIEATYREQLPTGEYVLAGRAVLWSNLLMLPLTDRAGVLPMQLALHRPSPPASLLGGLISGATLVGPEATPSASRFLALRTALPVETVAAGSRYLRAGESIVADLRAAGCDVARAGIAEDELERLLCPSDGSGLNQMPKDTMGSLVGRLDRLLFEPG